MTKDSYRQRVYDSECALRAHPNDSIEECQALVDRALERRGLSLKLTVKAASSNQQRAVARLWQNDIVLPTWAREPLTVLHELAHHLAPTDSYHNWRFCKILLELLHEEGLDSLAWDLQAQYDARGVPYEDPALRRRVAAKRRPDVSDVPNERGLFVLRLGGDGWYVRWVERAWDRVYVPTVYWESQARTWKTRRGAERVRAELAEHGWSDVVVERIG